MATKSELQNDLKRVREKIREVIETGTQYSVVGSHATTQPTIKNLRDEEARIIRRLAMMKGYLPRSKPDFNG